MTMENEFSWWARALSGEKVEITADAPQSGFYRMRRAKDGPWLPVMIRQHDGNLRCRVADDSAVDPHDVWTYCAGNPVSKEAAAHAFKHGQWETDAPIIGDNSGALSLADQIQEYAAQAMDWLRKIGGIKDKKQSDMAANYRAELLRLSKEADAAREAEKRPHDDAAKAVQAKWKPHIEHAKCAADTIRDELTKWMRAEEARLEAERRAKWEAEQKAAEEARKAIEAQRAKQLADDPIAAMTSPEPELPELPSMPEPAKVQAGGQRGRKTGLREVTSYVVIDHAAALAFFAESESVRELVQKLASQACKAGVTVPGVQTKTEKVAA